MCYQCTKTSWTFAQADANRPLKTERAERGYMLNLKNSTFSVSIKHYCDGITFLHIPAPDSLSLERFIKLPLISKFLRSCPLQYNEGLLYLFCIWKLDLDYIPIRFNIRPIQFIFNKNIPYLHRSTDNPLWHVLHFALLSDSPHVH